MPVQYSQQAANGQRICAGAKFGGIKKSKKKLSDVTSGWVRCRQAAEVERR